jgi:hypothetical protein
VLALDWAPSRRHFASLSASLLSAPQLLLDWIIFDKRDNCQIVGKPEVIIDRYLLAGDSGFTWEIPASVAY